MSIFESILEENFNYFVQNIEPYYFILYTYQNKALVIEVKKSNFGHLIGYEKSSNVLYSSKSGTELYKLFRNGKIKSLFDFIDKERFENNQLTLDEFFIYNKVMNFIDIFDSLINTTNIRLYTKIPGDDFNADYLQVKSFEHAIGYLGIVGSGNNDYHYFNSLLYEKK